MSPEELAPQPWAYTFETLARSIDLQLARMHDSPVQRDTITVEVVFAADETYHLDFSSLPLHVAGHQVRYPERQSVTRCAWELVVEGWTGPRGPDAECWTFLVAGNNL